MSWYPNDADGDALRRVVTEGSDMSQPMIVDFAVAAQDRESAESIAKMAASIGYMTDVVYDEGEDQDRASWTCYCSKSMILTYQTVVEAQRELEDLSRPFNGYSDGWGTLGNGPRSRA